ncbi:AAA domain-containing protein [Streptomyces sp. SID14478]|uniref:McrB family protein n=1 Tax=Streptomyces sp. SID14478 TaxID=2706073 RepID=UPI0013DD359D|nr:AAA family ATPase [Streptomyces sp. SID14478]NEB73841.1 AAA domain-containing protein [Streptomyces sp. SID14478]
MTTVLELNARAVHAAMGVLHRLASGHGLPFRQVWARVLEDDPTLKADWEKAFPQLATTARTRLQYESINLVKAGWLRKSGRVWRLTGPGRQAYSQYGQDSAALLAKAYERYGYWSDERAAFNRAAEVLETLPDDSRWVSVEDLAESVGLAAAPLRVWLQSGRPPGWYLALGGDGEVPDVLGLTEGELDEWRTLLEDNQVYDAAASGGRAVRARIDRRLSDMVLRERAIEDGAVPRLMQPRRRAWLIRGTDARGVNLITSLWRDKGVCTLAADRLPLLEDGVDAETIRELVETYYSHLSSARRTETTQGFHAFLSQMREGDIVLTTDGDQVFLGEIKGAATETVTGDGPVLQRAVDWVNADSPLAMEELPEALTGPLGNPNAGLLEISEFTSDLEVFLDEEPEQTPAGVVADAELPDATDELAREVTMPDIEWLQDCVELLRDRPQLILYGPPGTGKTFTALALARHLTGGRRANVRLVQFHSAYSYEDFFEGFRPRAVPLAQPESKLEPDGGRLHGGSPYGGPGGKDLSDAGSGIVFDLVQGPLKQLAEQAEETRSEIFVLVIDEINRAHLAKVFGELYFLLEYRKEFVHLLYGSDAGRRFRLPPNLVIIGTMNTTDRSIALMDAAMRRRFSFMELHPGKPPVNGVLAQWLQDERLPADAAVLLDALNARIAQASLEDRDFRIGPSYFLRPAVHTQPRGLERIWKHQILPLLTELHWGEDVDVEAEYGLESLRQETNLPAVSPVPAPARFADGTTPPGSADHAETAAHTGNAPAGGGEPA